MEGLNSVIMVPYGIGVLAASLRKNNIAVDLEDLNLLFRISYLDNPELRALFQDLRDFLRNQVCVRHYIGISEKENNLLSEKLLHVISIPEKCMLVGISVSSSDQILIALLLAEKIKKEYNKLVVFGGPYVTAFAHLFFQEYDFIDYAIVGEGEIPLLKLMRAISQGGELQNVPSLWYRNKSESVFTGRAFYDIEDQSCPDFDGLPLKSYEVLSEDKGLFIPYSISRGCVNECKFCIYRNIDCSWQTKSVKKAIQDIKSLKEKYGTDLFCFTDTNFNLSYQYVDSLCDGLIDSGLDIHWQTMCQPSKLDRNLLIKIKKAGCQLIEWGFESNSDKILRAMNKEGSVIERLGVLKMSKEAGICNLVHLIVGYPYETAEDLKKTALLIKNYADIIHNVHIHYFSLDYGSYVFHNHQKERINIQEMPHSFFTYTYGFQEIDKGSVRSQRELAQWRRNVEDYYYKYFVSRKIKSPYGIFLRIFGLKLLVFVASLLRKAYFQNGIYRYFPIKMIMRKYQGLARYLLGRNAILKVIFPRKS